MTTLQVFVDENTLRRLKFCASEMGRTIEDLAECAVAEAALSATRHMPDPIERKTNG